MNIYEMKLHEKILRNDEDNGDYEVIRVPGGWIYRHFSWMAIENQEYANHNWIGDSVFVPFNDEFQEQDIKMAKTFKKTALARE